MRRCGLLCDLIHLEGAEVKAVYGEDFYKGMPVVTVNRFGQGEAWYVASSPEQAFLQEWLPQVCADRGIVRCWPISAGRRGSDAAREGRR